MLGPLFLFNMQLSYRIKPVKVENRFINSALFAANTKEKMKYCLDSENLLWFLLCVLFGLYVDMNALHWNSTYLNKYVINCAVFIYLTLCTLQPEMFNPMYWLTNHQKWIINAKYSWSIAWLWRFSLYLPATPSQWRSSTLCFRLDTQNNNVISTKRHNERIKTNNKQCCCSLQLAQLSFSRLGTSTLYFNIDYCQLNVCHYLHIRCLSINSFLFA